MNPATNVLRLSASEADRKLAPAINSLRKGAVRAVLITRHGFDVAAIVALRDAPRDVRQAVADGAALQPAEGGAR